MVEDINLDPEDGRLRPVSTCPEDGRLGMRCEVRYNRDSGGVGEC